jgi:hypothetical protein
MIGFKTMNLKHSLGRVYCLSVYLLLFAGGFAHGADAENPMPATQPLGPLDKREATHGALLEARLKLLGEMKAT